MVSLGEGLERGGRFKVLSPSVFEREVAKEGGSLALTTSDERARICQKIARNVGADAIVMLTSERAQASVGIRVSSAKPRSKAGCAC